VLYPTSTLAVVHLGALPRVFFRSRSFDHLWLLELFVFCLPLSVDFKGKTQSYQRSLHHQLRNKCSQY
jgi:hypothetical protein